MIEEITLGGLILLDVVLLIQHQLTRRILEELRGTVEYHRKEIGKLKNGNYQTEQRCEGCIDRDSCPAYAIRAYPAYPCRQFKGRRRYVQEQHPQHPVL